MEKQKNHRWQDLTYKWDNCILFLKVKNLP